MFKNLQIRNERQVSDVGVGLPLVARNAGTDKGGREITGQKSSLVK